MGKLRLCLVVGLVACGSNNSQPDAHIVVVDASPDAKVFMDAPPPMYDFSCFGVAPPTTAADPITVAGTTDEVSMSGLTPVAGVTVDFFKTGSGNSLGQVTSAATTGAFTSPSIVTGGTPLDAYLRAAITNYRTTYLYPANKVVANIANVPVPMLSNSNFNLLQLAGQITQDDANNGVLFVVVTDCALMPINGATLTAKQGGTDVGMQFDLGQLATQAAGTFAVLNVPDGATDVAASYNGMNFPAHTVVAHKKQGTGPGTITATQVRPGP